MAIKDFPRLWIRSVKAIMSVCLVLLSVWTILVIRDDFQHGRARLSKWPFFSYLIDEHEQTKLMAKGMTLSYYVPSFDYLAKLIQGREPLNKDELGVYRNYYEKVDQIFPNVDQVYGMLGFCYYNTGQKEKAITFFQKAISLNPNFFWYHYNLGVIYFVEGSYQQAIKSFQKAIATDNKFNVYVIRNSKVYQQIFLAINDSNNFSIEQRLNDGISRAYLMWMASLEALGQKKEAQKLLKENEMILNIKNSLKFRPKEVGLTVF